MEEKRWIQKEINLGEVKSRTKVPVRFTANEVLNIKNIIASCGCTTPEYKKGGTKEVYVVFNSGDVPKHLEAVGYYTTTKTLTVFYEDGSDDILSFKAKIIK